MESRLMMMIHKGNAAQFRVADDALLCALQAADMLNSVEMVYDGRDCPPYLIESHFAWPRPHRSPRPVRSATSFYTGILCRAIYRRRCARLTETD